MSVLVIDFETRSACDIRKAGADVYARHPTTEVMCMGYAFDDEPVEIWSAPLDLSERVKDHVLTGGTVVGHNVAFELAIWNNVATPQHDWPLLDPAQTHCTMAMSYAMGLPGALEDAAPAAGLKVQKDTQGHRVMMQLSFPV